jgi:hypothetical protein
MAVLADRVRETSTTTGTGTFTLAGALPSYQSFNATFTNGALVYYVIQSATDYEIGVGTVGTGTLARTTVLRSSNAGALVPFAAGPKDVFVSYVADRAVTTVDAATLTNKTIDDYTNFIGANQLHIKVKATATLALGTVCKAVGWNAGENAVEVAAVSSTADIAIGVTDAVISIGDLGEIINTGYLEGINTNAFAPGTILYPNTSGGFTATKPSSGTYQAVAFVLRQNVSNGTVFVEFTNPQSVEASTNTANTIVLRDGSGNFAAGTMTGNVTGNVSGSSGSTTGNASTATALQTARNINGVAFNGTADITVTAAAGTLTGTTLASGVTASSLTSVGTLGTLTVSGNATFDTNTLVINASTDRVGLGTASPVTKVHVNDGTNRNVLITTDATQLGSAGMAIGSFTDAGVAYAPLSIIGSTIRFAPDMTLDTSGNLGLGVTPSTWGAGYKVFELGRIGSAIMSTVSTGTINVLGNAVFNGTNYVYANSSSPAARYLLGTGSGQHQWFTAPSGTAGNAITFTQAMTLDASGRLGIGTASPSFVLDVAGGVARLQQGFQILDTDGYFAFANKTVGNPGNYGFYYSGTTSSVQIWTANTQRVTVDASGNLGLGVTPSAWIASGGSRAFQFSTVGALYQGGSGGVELAQNAYESAVNTYRYLISFNASRYEQQSGQHKWFTAPSGTAGAAITFTQAMTLDASGNLGVGTASPLARLHVESAEAGMYLNSTTTTNAAFSIYQNAAGQFITGRDSSAGSTSGTAYAAYLWSLGAYPMVFATNGAERARITSSGLLLIGGKTSGTDKIEGVGFGINGNAGVSVSTSATTIFTVSQTVTGAMCVVFGDNGSSGFMDLLFFMSGNTPVVVSSQTMYGTPPVRTYTFSTTALRCALASGTHTLRTAAFSPINT